MHEIVNEEHKSLQTENLVQVKLLQLVPHGFLTGKAE